MQRRRRLMSVVLTVLAVAPLVVGSEAHASSSFAPLTPGRLFDTRNGAGGVPARPLGDREVLSIDVRGRAGIGTDGVAAVALNVTVNRPSAPGFITVYPCGPRPTVSNLNYGAGQTIANAVIAPVSSQGRVCFYAERSTHLVVDVTGWFPVGMTSFTPLAPRRWFDTRDGTGGVVTGPVASRATLAPVIAGRLGVPSSGVAAVSINLTATRASGPGFVTAHSCSTARPLASSLNYPDERAVGNAVIAPVGPDGRVCFYVERSAHLVAEVNGWFSAGGNYTALRPSRLLDTRSTGMPLAPFAGSPLVPVPQVTNGAPVSIDEVPWQVRVTVNNSIGCGGSLIHRRWVLTAAHCLVNESGFVVGAPGVRVWAGISQQTTMTFANSLAVADVIVHPGFDRTTFANDLALLELAAATDAGRPIELFTDPGGPPALTLGRISGWGETVPGSQPPDQLHAAWVYVRAGPTGPCGNWGSSYQPSIMICASGGISTPDGAGGCRGDSGGPLAIDAGGMARLAGVVSFGAGGCPNSHSAPTVFARVSSYVPWIREFAPAPGQLADDVLEVPVTGRAGVPASGVAAVVLNVTSTGTVSPGYVTVFPCGPRPLAANLATVPGRAVANLVIAPVSSSGSVCLYSPTATHVVVDVVGYLSGPG